MLVSDILHAAPEGGLVFLEVPSESPLGLTRIFRRLAQIGIVALTHPSLAEFIVRPATLFMILRTAVETLLVLHLHESINTCSCLEFHQFSALRSSP